MKKILVILFASISFSVFGQVYESQLRINPDESTDSTQVMISRDTNYPARFQGRGLWTSIARFGELVSPYVSGALSSAVDSIYLSNDTLYIVYFDAPTLAVKTSGLNGVYSTTNNAKNLGVTTAYYKAGSGLTLSTNAGLGQIGFNTVLNVPLVPTGNSASGYGIYILPNASNRSLMVTAASSQVWACGSVGNAWGVTDQTHGGGMFFRINPQGSGLTPALSAYINIQGDGDLDFNAYRDGTRPYLADWKNIMSTDANGQLGITSKAQLIDTLQNYISGAGDNWGSDVVNNDATLTGNGTSGDVLKVDTTIIATKTDISGITGDNFANADLTFTGDRTHDADGNDFTLSNIGLLTFGALSSGGVSISNQLTNITEQGTDLLLESGANFLKLATGVFDFKQTEGNYLFESLPTRATATILGDSSGYLRKTGFIPSDFALASSLSGKLNISDTASMLSHYIERGDTASMLSNYTTFGDLAGYQPLDADLTYLAGVTLSANVKTLLNAADYSAFKTSLSLNNVENTAISTWAGSTALTTLGTIGTGTWQGGVIGSTYGGTGVNNAGRTLTVNTNSGTIDFTGASKTLTVPLNASVSGTNTGDQTISASGTTTTYGIDLSASGGTVNLIEGTGITIDRTSNDLTINSSGGTVSQGKSFTWDGNGGIPAVGSTIYWIVPANITITGWSFWATGSSPTATIDVWKIASGTTLPAVGQTIISGTKPALSSGNAVRSSTLTAFTDTTFTSGEIVGINLDAVGVTTFLSFTLEYQ